MLTIYNSTTTSFSTLGLGVLKDFISDPLITEILNGSYTLEFEYSKNGFLSESLIEGNIIKANNQLFRICNIKKDMRKISILAKHIFFDLSNNFLEDVAPTNLSTQNALRWILDRTVTSHNFEVNGDCTSISSARYVRKNVIDAIYNEDNAILKRFGGEIELDNYNIFIHSKRGESRGYSIRYGKNLNGIEFNLDFSTVVTKIMPQGANELLLDEKYVISSRVNDYYQPLIRKIEFSDITVDENTTEEEAKEQLRIAANKLFEEGIDVPTISIKVDFIELSKCVEYLEYSDLESCHLGDTINAIIPDLNINVETRIVKTIYNCNLNRFTMLELGSIVPTIATETNKNNNEVNNKLQKINVESILNKAQTNATNMLNHPFNGNLLIDNETGVLYLMDTNDPNTATNVWKWSLGGLGFSSTGVNGTYGTAITQDGHIVADYITSGIISANRIEGYNDLITQVETMPGNIIEQAENKITDAIDEIRSTMIHQTDSQITMWFETSGTKQLVDDLDELCSNNQTTLNTISEYIHFEGAKITLGKSTSACKVVITNEKISFMVGDSECAYISNNQLYINEIVVMNKLQQGQFLDIIDSQGNLNKIWVGE